MKIAFCGDIALWRRPERKEIGHEYSIDSAVIEYFNQCDLVVGNIECPLTDNEQPQWNYFKTLRARKSAAKILKKFNIEVGSLANNHIADYGKKGLADTMSVLDNLGIRCVGADFSYEKANRPLVFTKHGISFGILALAQPEISAASRLAWGAGVLEDDYALNCMSLLSRQVDIAIAYLHFGVEFSEYPTPHQVRLSRGLVDAGAKLVIGHHPHVPQGYEHYKEGFIAYSLGNFIFDMADGPHRFSRIGLVIQADFNGRSLSNVKVCPVDTRGGITKILSSEELVGAEQYLRHLCSVLSDEKKLEKSYYFTCRQNFELYVNAFLNNVFYRRNWRQARDLIIQTFFWPQIFELRIDLARFLLTGGAFKFESSHKKTSRDLLGRLWKWLCKISFYFGLPFRWISRNRNL